MVAVTIVMVIAGTAMIVIIAGAAVISAPVVTVLFIAAVADDGLPAMPLVTCIFGSYSSLVTPWVLLVNYYFVAVVYIKITVTGRQCCCTHPGVILLIYVLMAGDIIIGINIWQIVIFNVVISGGPPIWLTTDVQIKVKFNLCIGYFYGEGA